MSRAASPVRAMTLGTMRASPANVVIIAVKIGLRTSPNTPEVTRAVRSLASTPTRQEAPRAIWAAKVATPRVASTRPPPWMNGRCSTAGGSRPISAAMGAATQTARAGGAQPIDAPLERPAPDGQAPIAGVTGAAPLNPRAYHTGEQQERDEQDQGGDRHCCSVPPSTRRPRGVRTPRRSAVR